MDEKVRQQLFFMRKAISLSMRGRFISPPNPWVGTVIVRNGIVVGEGWHEGPGTMHAEEMAVQSVGGGSDFSDCEIYVTLEPCSHIGRRPPCADLLVRCGFKTIFVGVEDPDERVSGNGIRLMRSAGLNVVSGICRNEIEKSLAPYLFQRRYRRPLVVLKTALSIDGYSSAADGSSQWITDVKARENVALERASSQAILVGIATVLKDNPRLTVRHPTLTNFNPPLRVVLDSGGRSTGEEVVFQTTEAPTLYVTTDRCSGKLLDRLEKRNVQVSVLPGDRNGINLHCLLELLQKKGCLRIFVEGGATLHGSFLKESLANILLVYYGACLLGNGLRGLSYGGPVIRSISEKYVFQLNSVRKLGKDVRIEYFCPTQG